MPVGLETRFKRLLKEIISISSGIRYLALDYASGRNLDVSERLCHQLETIRISADAILQAIAKASHTSYSLDDRIADWLASVEPHSCLAKLKEMNNLLRPINYTEDPAPSLTAAEDRSLVAAMAFFNDHKSLFQFLLTPGVWNRERLDQRSEAIPPNVTAIGDENGPRSPQAKATDRKKELLHQKLGEISRWLAPMECIQKHKDALRLRQEGTCKWFPNTDVYEKWRTPGNRFLWLHGKGGCGKSVLIAYTIEHLRTSLREDEVVVFFYCDFQNKRSTNSTELVRSLLSQLLRHIRDHGVDPGDFPDKVLEQKSEGTLSLDHLGNLCDTVSRAASFFRYEPMIVIDALDECADIETLLPALVTLSQSDVRLLVTSRPDQTIMDHFTGLQSLSFEDVTEEIAADIGLHVRRELDSHNRLRSAISEMKDEIDAKLTRKAEGRFRWVQCQLDTLRRCTTREELSEALDSLPNELEATYERILGAIDERKSDGELARRVLALLMAALEPLRVAQIVDGLSMDFEERKYNHETQQWLETKLLPSLSSLVSYYEETDVLVLSHCSVKEYLTSCSALPMYQIAFHQAHVEAVRMCMGYISVYLRQEFSLGNLERFPMLSYVLSSGFNHLAYVDSESPVALGALQSLASDARHYPSHWDRLCELREEILEWPFAPWPSSKHDFALYVLIAYSPPGLLRTFLSSPLQPRIRTNPLVYAADLRKTEHAMVLLDHGADVDARGLVIDDSYRTSPLEVAIDLGDDILVEELLQRGCLVTPELLATAVCMPWCRIQVLAKLMQTDEFVEFALEIGEEKLYRSVFSSARPNSGDSMKTDKDHLVLARRLRQLGLDLSAESQFGKELIERALHAAHVLMLEFLLPPDEPPPAEFLIAASTGDTSEAEAVVRFLLQKGVDLHAVSTDGSKNTALHLAAMCPWEPRSLKLTRLLIDAGCDPHALNSNGETPLVVAVRHGHCSVVKLSLSCNVPLPSDILHAALERHQNPQMIEFLLYRGADINAIAQSTGDTILHAAIVGPHQELERLSLVKYLLEAGCDPTIRNSFGQTALEMAMQQNSTSVVEVLLSPNVPLPRNALSSALLQKSTLEMVERLIQRGADARSITSDGDSLLHLALYRHRYPEEMCCKLVKRLIDAGCDTTAHNSTGKTALEMAMELHFTSVVEVLLSPNIPLPPDVLSIALQQCSTLEIVEGLIHRGADVHSITSKGNSLLHLALYSHHYPEEMCYKLVKRLVDAGCDTTARNSVGKTAVKMAMDCDFTSVVEVLLSPNIPLPPDALSIAIQQGLTLEMVEDLIHRGADVCSITSNGDSLLHLALYPYRYSEETCCKLVKRLTDAGCNTTARNFIRKTAPEMAVERSFISVVEVLLPLGAPLPPNILLVAVQQGSTLEMAEYLIHRGANVHSTMSNGDTVLHLALYPHRYRDEEMCCKLVKRLINTGCNIAAHNYNGRTAMEIAIDRNFTSVVEVLLSQNIPLPPNVLVQIMTQRCPTLKMVEYLIERGADVDSITSDGDSLLHLVLHRLRYSDDETHCKLVKTLIDAGCDTTLRNSIGKTVLEIAMERHFNSVVEVLLLSPNIPLPPNALQIMIQQGSALEMVERLIERGADVDSITSDGDSLLHLVLHPSHCPDEETRCKLVKMLINAGCDTTLHNSIGQTALGMAMTHRFTSVVEVLLLSPNIPLPPNALQIMIQQGSTLEMVERLIERGADVHSVTSIGDSLLHLAVHPSHCPDEEMRCKLVKMLINAGCDTTLRNFFDQTALEMAMGFGLTSMVSVLLLSPILPLPFNALRIALLNGLTLEIIEGLIQRGADIHSTSSDGDSLLHLALYPYRYSEETCCKLVKRLIDAGCNITAPNSIGKTALEMAMDCNFTSVVDILLLSPNVPLPFNALQIALWNGSTLEVVERLIERGANACSMYNGDFLLHLALHSHRYRDEETCCNLVKRLIDAGCDTTTRLSFGKTALEIAMDCDFTSVVDVLLLSPNLPLPFNALQIALWNGSTLEVVERLIERGANACSMYNQDSLLHLALHPYRYRDEGTCCKLVKRLVNAGCNTTAHDWIGRTPLDIAMHRNFTSVVEALRSEQNSP